MTEILNNENIEEATEEPSNQEIIIQPASVKVEVISDE